MPADNSHLKKPALLCDADENGGVYCRVCQRQCHIKPGRKGYCQGRINEQGSLYSLLFGRVSSIAVSPIEKKPLFHFYPGSLTLSLGTLGCNFRCPGCQNWHISHHHVTRIEKNTEYVLPEQAVGMALDNGCQGISWTYNEPATWFEYTLDCAKLAKETQLHTSYVTNGYLSAAALDMLGPYLDSFRVDLKGFSPETYSRLTGVAGFEGILDVTRRAKLTWHMHVEVVTNVTPRFNDDTTELSNMARWILNNLGEDTPWHLTRFVPHRRLSHLPMTPINVLEGLREMARATGLRYVYLGNIPGHPGENTYCASCGRMIISRNGFTQTRSTVLHGSCPFCGHAIPGRF